MRLNSKHNIHVKSWPQNLRKDTKNEKTPQTLEWMASRPCGSSQAHRAPCRLARLLVFPLEMLRVTSHPNPNMTTEPVFWVFINFESIATAFVGHIGAHNSRFAWQTRFGGCCFSAAWYILHTDSTPPATPFWRRSANRLVAERPRARAIGAFRDVSMRRCLPLEHSQRGL